MADSITLPRSGVVLTHTDGANGVYSFIWDIVGLNCYIERSPDRPASMQFRAHGGWYTTANSSLEDAAAWLDGYIMKLRAALLAGDAVRERIARALNESHRRFDAIPNSECYDCDCDDDGDVSPPQFDELCAGCRKSQNEEADAVLRALGGGD